MPTQAQSPVPPAKFHWFLPTNGDSRSIVGASHASSHHTVPANYRAPSRRYLAEIARAADRLGYEGVLFIAKLGDVTDTSVVTLNAQQNTINSSSGMATLSGSATYTCGASDADNDLLILDVFRPRERYARALFTSATANAVKNGIIAIRYGARKQPITQGSTVLATATLIEAAEA